MNPEIEREYKAWIEEMEAWLAARVRWSNNSHASREQILDGEWAFDFLEKLKRIRDHELTERFVERVRVAGR